MSKSIYVPDSGGIARQAKKIYIPVDGVAHKVKKIYVGDAENKARLAFSSEYVWKKYVSKVTRESPIYYNYTGPTDYTRTINIWPTPDSDFATVDSSDIYTFHGGSTYYYSWNNGTFYFSIWVSMRLNKSVSPSQYDIDNKFSGMWLIELDGRTIWKVGSTENSDLRTLTLTQRCVGGNYAYTRYFYSYEYVGDVTSENENAYTSGTVGDYYVNGNSDDIRTVYIRKD